MLSMNRFFLMFASLYACVVVYFVLNKNALARVQPQQPVRNKSLLGNNLENNLRRTVVEDSPTVSSEQPEEDKVVEEKEPQEKEVPTTDDGETESTAEDVVSDYVNAVVKCFTTVGELIIDVRAAWAPVGAARFLELVENGHFTDLPFYRVCPKYLTQFGKRYYDAAMKDPDDLSELKDDNSLFGIRDMDFGYFFFAASSENSRKYEMAISFCEMANCDVTGLGHKAWEVPVATVRKGYFDTLYKIMETGYPYPKLEVSGIGRGPDVEKIMNEKDYLKEKFPEMAYFKSCKVVQPITHALRKPEIDHPQSVQLKKKGNTNAGKTESEKKQRVVGKESNAAALEILEAKDDDTDDLKSLEEYLLGGDKRKQVMDPQSSDTKKAVEKEEDAPEEAVVSESAPQVQTKPPVPPSGLAGAPPFRVVFEIKSGDTEELKKMIVEIYPEWAPLGAKRFQDLVSSNFFNGCRFFRAIKGFVAQFGIPAQPISKTHPWARLPIPDDAVASQNARGTLTFASAGKNSRSNQLYFNLGNNFHLDKEGFSPIGKVVEGEEALDSIYTGYGDKPNQGKINQMGNDYLDRDFPELTSIVSVKLIHN